jgi:Tol biopolymer transport system component
MIITRGPKSQTRRVVFVVCALAAALGLAACALPIGKVRLPAQITTLAPELFGPGTISTPENELNAAFSPDGTTLYFTRAAGANGRFGVIVVSKALRDDHWSTPEVVDFSGRYSDYDPIVSPDGSRLFFISKRPLTGQESGQESGQEPRPDFDIWVVERAGGSWGEPRNLGGPVNGDGDELYPSVASDGTLYFSSCGRPDSRGRCDLYRARFREDRYLEPENLGEAINTTASETDAYVAPDQSYLVFAAYGRPDAIGDGDLYVSHFRDGTWSTPRPLGPSINTVAREYCPIVSPDGKYLYFTSQHGFLDAQQPRALTYSQLRDSLRSIHNGFGNIYRVPISTISDSQ